MSEPLCANCGHPRNNHPFRHPFAGPSKDDTIKELEAKLAKAVEALNSMAILPSHGYIKYFCRKTLAEIEGETHE